MKARQLLNSLGHFEVLERPCARFGFPHIPEYDLGYFQKLYHADIVQALGAFDKNVASLGRAEDYIDRGRARRLLGDDAGAARDYARAIESGDKSGLAWAWLGELFLERAEAEAHLTSAMRTNARLAWPYLYRGAHYLLAGRDAAARSDLREFSARKPGSCLGFILAGLAEERLGSRRRAARLYQRAAALNRVCSAAYLLRARVARTPAELADYCRRAYDVSPVLGFLTLQIHRELRVEDEAYLRRILKLSFDEPETVGALYRRETTQSHFSNFPAEDYDFVARLIVGRRRRRGRVLGLSRRNPNLAWAHAFLGRSSCYKRKGLAEGVERLNRAVSLAPHAGWHRAWRANAERLMGKLPEALADFDRAIALQPYYHRSFVWRGALLRKMGRAREALADLDRAIAMDPYYSLTFHERSLARRATGDLLGAVHDLDQAFWLDSRYSWVFKTGREPTGDELDLGIRELTGAIAAFPHAASFYAWRGQLYLQKKLLGEAFKDFDQGARLDPRHALVLGWHGRGQLESGQPVSAEKCLARATELEPRFLIARGWLARALFLQGRDSAARGVLRAVLRNHPKTPWALLMMGQFDLERNRSGRAIRHLSGALALDGKYPEAYLELAQAKLEAGDLRGALRAADRCFEVAPNMGRVYIVRALARERLGRTREALADYRTALRDFPYLFNPEQRLRVEALLAART